MSDPEWRFCGKITHREDKTTAKGKAMQNLVIARQDTYGPVLCVCSHFGDMPATTGVGATVLAEGWMSGREYNGRHYAGLRATRVYVERESKRDDGQSEPPAEPRPAFPYQPPDKPEAVKTDDLPF